MVLALGSDPLKICLVQAPGSQEGSGLFAAALGFADVIVQLLGHIPFPVLFQRPNMDDEDDLEQETRQSSFEGTSNFYCKLTCAIASQIHCKLDW